jgi:phosphoheptose isomerase
VEYLQASAKLGQMLVVAVNSDASVKSLKGPYRPVHAQEDRAAVIAALGCVDHVFIFEGPRLDREILQLKPDFYTKAGDYSLDSLDPTERSALEAIGTEIRFQPFVPGHSTTKTVNMLGTQRHIDEEQRPFGQRCDQLRQLLVRCDSIQNDVERGFKLISECLSNGGKVLACGNGGSAADAMHLIEELIGRFKLNRIPLPGICLNSDPTVLTCIANDYGYDHVFARQVQGLGRPSDVLVLFSTSGNSNNIVEAIRVSNEIGLKTILVTGNDAGRSKGLCSVDIVVPDTQTARIQEVHTLILHSWLEQIDTVYARP